MRINRRFFYSVGLFLSQLAFSKNKNEPIDSSLNSKLCEANFLGSIEGSLLRLSRGNLVELSTRWTNSSVYKMNSGSQEISVSYNKGGITEVLSEKDPLFRALSEERDFVKKLARKKLSSNLAALFSAKQSFEFQSSVGMGSKVVDIFKWNFESEGRVYSYGLAVPLLSNVDPDIFYNPIVPHCSEEKLSEFKTSFKPLQYLWTLHGVPTGEQGADMFKDLRSVLPEKK